MSAITIDIGLTGLTNVMALPYSADLTQVWNGTSLVSIDSAAPVFINMTEVLVNSVGSGNYKAELPAALETISDNDGLWISIYNAGTTPKTTDPLYGYIPPSCQSTLIKAVTDAIAKLEINIDPCDLKRALAGANIQPTRVVFGPCQTAKSSKCSGS
ncbi:MAG: hypothetical protein M0R50_11150 [Candidatus Cloacimonetes bacterium]|jgi:hypothetical protein|nr:hypothetical protein [Candidatus Cloacimonadota bacterium]